MLSPILLTVYDRTSHLRRCIEHLKRCHESKETVLFVASDAAYRNEDESAVDSVRAFIKTIDGFKQVIPILHSRNQGLVGSYYMAVNRIFDTYHSYIFLEDDILVAPDFLTYMNKALEFYRDDPSVFSVSGFSFSMFYPVSPEQESRVYFTNRFYPWGYGQWKHKALSGSEYSPEAVDRSLHEPKFRERLEGIGEDLLPAFLSLRAQGKMLVLDYLHTYHMVLNDLVAVAPYRTKTINIGHDGSGSRTARSEKFERASSEAALQETTFTLVPNRLDRRDESYNLVHFRSAGNRIKMALYRAGLLKPAMQLVNWYRGRK